MTSLKQIEANRRNAFKSTGPRTEGGKQKSSLNALRHGLTAETVVTALENATDYQAFEMSIVADYQPKSATEHELVARLASLLWRLRRSTKIETGLFELQGEFMRERMPRWRRRLPVPEWKDELDSAPAIVNYALGPPDPDIALQEEAKASDLSSSETLASCYLQVSRLGYGAFDLLSRYEAALWRQAAQILFMLQTRRR